MSATDFLPRREADLRDFSINFDAKINADPAAFGLTAAMAADYRDKHNAFLQAYQRANEPSTRTPPSITAKNDAQKLLRQAARQLARYIHGNPAVTATRKQELGLTVRRPGGRSAPIPQPRSAPLMSVVGQLGSQVKLRLRDAEHPARLGRPAGTSGAVLLYHAGPTAPADPAAWSYLQMTGRSLTTITLSGLLQPGEQVWLTARWFNPRNQLGPAATPISIRVQEGIARFCREDSQVERYAKAA